MIQDEVKHETSIYSDEQKLKRNIWTYNSVDKLNRNPCFNLRKTCTSIKNKYKNTVLQVTVHIYMGYILTAP